MKLSDLIHAFADEVKNAMPHMERWLEQLGSLTLDDPDFLNALDNYNSQAQRMGEAAEMAGFSGLNLVCNHISENTLLLVTLEPEERQPVIDFLSACPGFMVFYLENLEDPSGAAGLIDLLRSAPSPIEIEQALKITYQLGAIPVQTSGNITEEGQARPVLAEPSDVVVEIPQDVDTALLESFLQEAPSQAEYLVALSKNLVSGEGDSSDIVAAKRVAHTLKGSSATVGIRGISSICHHLEDILEYFEETDGVSISHAAANLVLDTAFCLTQIIDHLLGSDEPPAQALNILQALIDTANRIERGETIEDRVYRTQTQAQSQVAGASGGQPSAKTAAGSAVHPAAPSSALRINTDRIDELFRLSGEVMVQSAAVETRIRSLADVTKQLMLRNINIQKRLFELESAMHTSTHSLALGKKREAEDSFDLLELDEYNEMHSATSALMEEASDVRAYVNQLDNELSDLGTFQLQQQHSVKDLQYVILSTRMAKVATIESRLQRNIRTTCQTTGKSAQLNLVGGDTLVDTQVLNQLSEPLLHLLRNAVDHGIEDASIRADKGKPETGQITLTFSRKGQQIVLSCTDDGKGLDLEAIRQKAIAQNIIASDAAMTDDEIAQLVFRSGFSTRDSVSEVSGRGVGMDVVREWVHNMNGAMHISSPASGGTKIEMSFSASLSNLQSMIVKVGEQIYAIPYIRIQQAVACGVGKISKLDKQHIFEHENLNIPFKLLANLVGEPVAEDKALDGYDVVVARLGSELVALGVDALIDARDLLIHTPKRYASKVRGISGLSILGDGSIAINLDLANLSEQGRSVRATNTAAKVPSAVSAKMPTVLIVDDALSVRNSLKQLIEDMGLVAKTARDGVDAVEKLEEEKPDIVLTDLEMPNLNGVELTAYIKNQSGLKDLPVVMITSRSQKKHKELAEKSGVDAYLTKPYNDAEVIGLIQRYLKANHQTKEQTSATTIDV